MRKYKIYIDRNAVDDIKNAAEWYNLEQKNLGKRFTKQVKLQINSLKLNPCKCSIRYANVRCLLINKFPFQIHYTVDNSTFLVEIYAVIHTSRNPKIWELKTNKK